MKKFRKKINSFPIPLLQRPFVRVVLVFHALLTRSIRCSYEGMRVFRKLQVKTLGNIYMSIYRKPVFFPLYSARYAEVERDTYCINPLMREQSRNRLVGMKVYSLCFFLSQHKYIYRHTLNRDTF